MMANVEKFTRAATGHMCAHYERAKGEDGEYIRFGNQNIDTEKSRHNYNLAPEHEGGQVEFIRRRTSEVKCLNRADVNVMCSWIVTLPKGVEKERAFFEETYLFLAERYGKENVVSAYVHTDEKQPHIHFSFVPVTVGKNGKEKVSAKEVLTKFELQRFHPELQAALEKSLGREVPILNGATAGGNRTVAELKAEQEAAKALEAAEDYAQKQEFYHEEAEKASQAAETVKGEVNTLRKTKDALQGQIDGLQARLLTEKEVIALKGQKTLTGALKGVSYEDYEALRRTAQRVGKVDAERDKAIERVKAAEKKAAAAEERAKQALNEKPSMKMQMENVTLRAKLDRMEKRLKQLLNYIPEQIRAAVQNILHDRDPFHREQQEHKQDRGMGGMER